MERLDLLELWKRAPEDATHVSSTSPMQCYYKDIVEGVSFKFMNRDNPRWLDAEGSPRWPLEPRPVEPKPIKTLEQRIIERAHEHLQEDVQEAMRHMRSVAKNRVDQPSGIPGMTVAEAIDAIGSAITKLRMPDVADYALESSLNRLADQLDQTRLISPR